ncbi:Y+L amino acid transporter 2-like isoform X1 [Biomphalaria glabrata]|uniref:Y+L amino acid transporter 2-like isoform X1 n=1 Tax=Biomphalaria glabrata TaxID=6526 RepID=A0A9W3B9C4_BIOGL|nr:Y+L amino acid transporter 2-like isoform X1 [Biomphalaria glabrata]
MDDSMPKESSAKKLEMEPMVEKQEGKENGNEGGIVLKQNLSLLNGITVIVGSIIGSGIFVSPKGVLKGSGSVGMSLIVWLLSGVYSMIGAFCYCELGTSIVRSGADYAYIFEAFGPFLAFLRLWVECMIVRPCSQAIVALTFAYYVIEPLFPDCDQPEVAVRLLAVICILILTFVNCASVTWATRVQDVFTYAKLIALCLIIITGFVQLGRGEFEYFQEPFANTETDIGEISLAFYSGLFAYNGWNYLNFVIEELKNPYKNLPKAIWISIILVTAVYVMTNIAYFTTVSPDEILGGAAVAVMFSKRLYGMFWWCMPVFVSLSTFGGVNGILFTTSRLFYVGGREGHMPQILSMVQIQRLTPMPACLFMGALSLCYLASSDIYALINYVGFATWLSIGMAVVVLLYLRWKRPNMHRPIKVHLAWPIIYTIVTIYLVILPLYASPMETGIGVAIICTGIPVYFIFVAWSSKPKVFTNFMDKMTIFLQRFLMVVPEEKKVE